MSSFSKIVTAEFQVVSIDAVPAPSNVLGTAGGDAGATGIQPSRELHAGRLRTRVRYDLVGSGQDFYREQRVGEWEIEWEANSPGDFRVKNWRALDETRSRAADPVYVDIAAQALGSNP